jgi:hypothetical protein
MSIPCTEDWDLIPCGKHKIKKLLVQKGSNFCLLTQVIDEDEEFLFSLTECSSIDTVRDDHLLNPVNTMYYCHHKIHNPIEPDDPVI